MSGSRLLDGMHMEASAGDEPWEINYYVFVAHIIPGVAYFLMGLYGLLKHLQHARKMPPGAQFDARHLPQQDESFLKTLAYWVIPITVIGIVIEAVSNCVGGIPWFQPCYFQPIFHEILYSMYGLLGVVALLENSGRLPSDSTRLMLALADFLSYFLWAEHAAMKTFSADGLIHQFLANLCLMSVACILYSIKFPTNVVSAIGVWGLLVLTGVWFFTAAYCYAFGLIPYMVVAPLFCFWTLVVTFSIIGVALACLPPQRTARGDVHTGILSQHKTAEFAPLQTSDEEEG